MFGFAFALVPLYDVICEVTGLNGKTGGRHERAPAALKPDLPRRAGSFRHQYQCSHALAFWGEAGRYGGKLVA